MQAVELPVSVLMQRREPRHRFGQTSWQAVALACASGPPDEAHDAAHDADGQYWVGGLVLRLTPDEALGYMQNLVAAQPKVFVLWRMEDGRARPMLASASYDAGVRMLDSGEHVDAVSLPPEVAEIVARYVEQHWARVERDQRKERRVRSD